MARLVPARVAVSDQVDRQARIREQ